MSINYKHLKLERKIIRVLLRRYEFEEKKKISHQAKQVVPMCRWVKHIFENKGVYIQSSTIDTYKFTTE